MEFFPDATHDKYLLSVELGTVEVGDAARHICTGGHGHQAVTLGTGTACVRYHLGTQNLRENTFYLLPSWDDMQKLTDLQVSFTFPYLPNRFFRAAALVFEDRPLTHTFREEPPPPMTPEQMYARDGQRESNKLCTRWHLIINTYPFHLL